MTRFCRESVHQRTAQIVVAQVQGVRDRTDVDQRFETKHGDFPVGTHGHQSNDQGGGGRIVFPMVNAVEDSRGRTDSGDVLPSLARVGFDHVQQKTDRE